MTSQFKTLVFCCFGGFYNTKPLIPIQLPKNKWASICSNRLKEVGVVWDKQDEPIYWQLGGK